MTERDEQKKIGFGKRVAIAVSEKPIEFGALIVAVLSFLFSLYGINVADRAQSSAKQAQEARRSIVLVGDSGENEMSLRVTPIQSDMTFLSGKAYFPSEINEGAVPIDNDGELRWTASLIFALQELAKQNVPPIEGHVIASEGGIPVVIYSYYAFEGVSYEDWSLYNVPIFVQINPPESGGMASVRLKGLIFGSRLNALGEEEAVQVPDTVWNAMKLQGMGTLEIPQIQ